MAKRPDPNEIQDMAEEIFDVWTLGWVNAAGEGGEENGHDLNELELLTLHLLTKAESLSVGELQQVIRVSPTKMSRIIRGLEREGAPALVKRRFNPHDRRKVDISITPEGREAHRVHRAAKLSTLILVLEEMLESDRADFIRLIRIVRGMLGHPGRT